MKGGSDATAHALEDTQGTATTGEGSESPSESSIGTESAAVASEGLETVVDVYELDWSAVSASVKSWAESEARPAVARAFERLAGGPPDLAFDQFRAFPEDRVLLVPREEMPQNLWFIGDLHGDLLALETALQHIRRQSEERPTIVFLGDLFDDGIHSFEVVARVYSLLLEDELDITVLAGNHDEALQHAEGVFRSDVSPSDFTDWLNSRRDEPEVQQIGQLVIQLFSRAPRALFFGDGLLAAHAGVPHTDLHPALEADGDWNQPACLRDFVWTRAHPRARRKIPNRSTKGCQFGREDFEDFCLLTQRLGRPVDRMIRGHDHVDERFEVYELYERNPVLTINTLSHQLPREVFGPFERVPCIARATPEGLPQVHRLHIPAEVIREWHPEPADGGGGEQP